MALDASSDAEVIGAGSVGDPPRDGDSPLAIEARGIEKTFLIPTQRVSRLKERAVNPFSRVERRALHALRDVSFDVSKGEFFGIVGRNGSGKSTLLKVMASIYRADAGRVRMAGQVAPFIELGVGFDMELSARENVALNGVMMGLTAKEARRRLDAVVEFAELEDFVEVKLKNYSSGMLVRLGFSLMIQSDAEILLIDEVLAVGDASFQQKCADTFQRMRGKRTIVFVTHDMSAVEEYCHRAMLLSEGCVVELGDPGQVSRRYLRLNFEQKYRRREEGGGDGKGAGDARLLDAWLEEADGERIDNVEQRQPIRLRLQLEAQRAVPGAQFGLVIAGTDGVKVHELITDVRRSEIAGEDLYVGQQVQVKVELENLLSPGRYHVHFGLSRNMNRYDVALYAPDALGFVVFGEQKSMGIVTAAHEISVEQMEPRR